MELHIVSEANRCLNCKKAHVSTGLPHPHTHPSGDSAFQAAKPHWFVTPDGIVIELKE